MSGDDPRVGIVMRTKDRPVLLRRALGSVADQDFLDYELVVVNDGGDPAIVDDLVAHQPDQLRSRTQVMHHRSPTGRWPAANAGVSATSSQYLTIHDDDDSWHKSFLSTGVEHLSRRPDEFGVATRTEVIFERLGEGQVHQLSRELLAQDQHEISLQQMIRHNYAPPISIVYRRSMHDQVGLFDESLPVLGDWDFMLKALTVAPMGFIDGEPLARWHLRPTSSGSDGNSVDRGTAEHARWDPLIRDRYLRSELAKNSDLGTLLFLSGLAEAHHTSMNDHLSLIGSQVEAIRDVLSHITTRLESIESGMGDTHGQVAQVDRKVEHLGVRGDRMADRLASMEADMRTLPLSAQLRALRSRVGRRIKRTGHSR